MMTDRPFFCVRCFFAGCVFRAFATALAMLALAPPAIAGDFAKRAILGFSADGKLFAFEEYGVQDGSGFPYSNIYIIDTASDRWTAGSPFRVLVENENGDLAEARETARQQAGTTLAAITEPGLIAATNQPHEIVADPHRMVARPRVFNPPTSERIEFRIETFAIPGEEFCRDFGETLGFRLTQIYKTPGRTTRLLHEDRELPRSRFCPLDYRLADVVTHHPPSGAPVVAILILMELVGFEGPDGRFLAVTAPLE